MKIKKDVDKCIKENMFGEEDRKIATFMFSLFQYSPKKLAKSKDKDYKKWFKNLKKDGTITKDMKISVSADFEKYSGIEFIMMMMVAKGLLESVQDKKKEVKNGKSRRKS